MPPSAARSRPLGPLLLLASALLPGCETDPAPTATPPEPPPGIGCDILHVHAEVEESYFVAPGGPPIELRETEDGSRAEIPAGTRLISNRPREQEGGRLTTEPSTRQLRRGGAPFECVRRPAPVDRFPFWGTRVERFAVTPRAGCVVELGAELSCSRLGSGELRTSPPSASRIQRLVLGRGLIAQRDDGRLFRLTEQGTLLPTATPDARLDARLLAANQDAVCGVSNAGSVTCVDAGTLAPHAEDEAPTLPFARAAVELRGSGHHFCARSSEGEVACWGADDLGQLGDGPGTAESGGVVSPRLTTPTRALASEGDSMCALGEDGRVRCWGRVIWRTQQLESADEPPIEPSPVVLEGLEGIVAVAGSCALDRAGGVRCWGVTERSCRGPRGSGCFVRTSAPSPVQLEEPIVRIASRGARCFGTRTGRWLCDRQPPPRVGSLGRRMVLSPHDVRDLCTEARTEAHRALAGVDALRGWNEWLDDPNAEPPPARPELVCSGPLTGAMRWLHHVREACELPAVNLPPCEPNDPLRGLEGL